VPTPLISVVVPSFERPDGLHACLGQLAEQALERDAFEVIVCDDGSARPLETLLGTHLEALRGRLQLRILRQENAGPAAARNRGAGVARGRFLAFTDDDCRPHRDWLPRLLSRFSGTPETLIGGALANGVSDDRFAAANQHLMDFVYETREGRRGGRRFFSTSNLAVPAEGFRRLNGFSTAFRRAAGEDYDFCARWQDAGLPMTYAPEAVVCHAHPLSLRTFSRQHFDYGRALYLVRHRIADRNGSRMRGESPGFYLRMMVSPLRNSPRGRRWFEAGLLAWSQAMTFAGVCRQAFALQQNPESPASAGPRQP
jgi:GT2 family glycosyltransferase